MSAHLPSTSYAQLESEHPEGVELTPTCLPVFALQGGPMAQEPSDLVDAPRPSEAIIDLQGERSYTSDSVVPAALPEWLSHRGGVSGRDTVVGGRLRVPSRVYDVTKTRYRRVCCDMRDTRPLAAWASIPLQLFPAFRHGFFRNCPMFVCNAFS